jgi:hypothetical protein
LGGYFTQSLSWLAFSLLVSPLQPGRKKSFSREQHCETLLKIVGQIQDKSAAAIALQHLRIASNLALNTVFNFFND